MQKLSILIIGGGNMGASLARGLVQSKTAKELQVRVVDKSEERKAFLTKANGFELLTALPTAKMEDDVVVLCVKPQDLGTVANGVAGKIKPTALVVSILAGTPIEDIASQLKFKGAIVRAMPNIAAMVGAAATAMCANEVLSETQRDWAQLLFSAVGEAYWTKESLLDAVTGLSGSGPAYIYMVIEALTDGGVKMGLPRQLAANLATQTVLGSAALVKATGSHPAVLRDQVTTPGGTTISAVHELEAHGLRAMLMSAVATATEHSAKLRAKAKV